MSRCRPSSHNRGRCILGSTAGCGSRHGCTGRSDPGRGRRHRLANLDRSSHRVASLSSLGNGRGGGSSGSPKGIPDDWNLAQHGDVHGRPGRDRGSGRNCRSADLSNSVGPSCGLSFSLRSTFRRPRRSHSRFLNDRWRGRWGDCRSRLRNWGWRRNGRFRGLGIAELRTGQREQSAERNGSSSPSGEVVHGGFDPPVRVYEPAYSVFQWKS